MSQVGSQEADAFDPEKVHHVGKFDKGELRFSWAIFPFLCWKYCYVLRMQINHILDNSIEQDIAAHERPIIALRFVAYGGAVALCSIGHDAIKLWNL